MTLLQIEFSIEGDVVKHPFAKPQKYTESNGAGGVRVIPTVQQPATFTSISNLPLYTLPLPPIPQLLFSPLALSPLYSKLSTNTTHHRHSPPMPCLMPIVCTQAIGIYHSNRKRPLLKLL